MLYSRMRKAVRQLNRFAYCFFRRELKEIKLAFVNRLVDITEGAYKKTPADRSEADLASICTFQITQRSKMVFSGLPSMMTKMLLKRKNRVSVS